VLAFPCNQFGKQEPGDHEQILEFTSRFKLSAQSIDFFEKANVNGPDAREVFMFLKEKLPSEDGSKVIKWNFTKFLVDHEGSPAKRAGPTVAPLDLEKDIEELLAKREAAK